MIIGLLIEAALQELVQQEVLRPLCEIESLQCEASIESIDMDGTGIENGYHWQVSMLGWNVLIESISGKMVPFYTWRNPMFPGCELCATGGHAGEFVILLKEQRTLKQIGINSEYCWNKDPGHTGGWLCSHPDCKMS